MGTWRKSTYSSGDGGQCLEAADSARVVLVRDTADRDGLTLAIPARSWLEFTRRLRS